MEDHQNPLDQTFSELTVQIRMRRSFFKTEWVNVKLFKLSESECIIKTDEDFSRGDKVTLAVRYVMDPVSFEINELTARVLNKTKQCSCFLYELTPELSDKAGSTSIVAEKIRKLNALLAHRKNSLKKGKIQTNAV